MRDVLDYCTVSYAHTEEMFDDVKVPCLKAESTYKVKGWCDSSIYIIIPNIHASIADVHMFLAHMYSRKETRRYWFAIGCCQNSSEMSVHVWLLHVPIAHTHMLAHAHTSCDMFHTHVHCLQ